MPFPSDLTQISPPVSSTICFTINRPRPVLSVDSSFSVVLKGLKISFCLSRGMPGYFKGNGGSFFIEPGTDTDFSIVGVMVFIGVANQVAEHLAQLNRRGVHFPNALLHFYFKALGHV